MNLTGTVPPEVDILENMLSISLPHNNLRGQLPRGLSHLQYLLALDVDENMLSGLPMDTVISQQAPARTSELAVLKLAYNSFDPWTLPSSIDTLLPNLQSLLLQGAFITGTVPTEIGNLSLLRKCPAAVGHTSLPGLHSVFVNHTRH